MSLRPDAIRARLEGVDAPGLGLDLVEAGMVREVEIDGGQVRVVLALPAHEFPGVEDLVGDCEDELAAVPGVEGVEIRTEVRVPAFRTLTAHDRAPASAADPWAGQAPVGEVRNVVAVSSGKGGVGKSTTAVNLAVALARAGAAVGLMDADIHGPSAPTMLGIEGKPELVDDRLRPLEAHGVKVMSIGFLTGEEEATVWRGAMIQGAVRQFVQDVEWGPLDYLVVDMPPGTGDAQLTLVQTVPLTGAVIVTTPQDVALIDARKGITMFRKVDAEILGVVENMSFFTCTDCGARHEIFAAGGGEREAERQGVPFLGGVPLVPAIREAGDAGVPVVVGRPDSPEAAAYREIAREVALRVARRNLRDPRRALAV